MLIETLNYVFAFSGHQEVYKLIFGNFYVKAVPAHEKCRRKPIQPDMRKNKNYLYKRRLIKLKCLQIFVVLHYFVVGSYIIRVSDPQPIWEMLDLTCSCWKRCQPFSQQLSALNKRDVVFITCNQELRAKTLVYLLLYFVLVTVTYTV